jgi:membrane protein YdbS with pleckstrin-like domain
MHLRPSVKTIMAAYVLCLAAGAAIAVYWLTAENQSGMPMWVPMLLPAALAAFAAIHHLRRRMLKLVILGDHLRYESGLFSKTTRTMELAKVQDVRVDQTIAQRLLNVGDVSLETAGGSSRVVMQSIDRPQEAADHILALARAAGLQGRSLGQGRSVEPHV